MAAQSPLGNFDEESEINDDELDQSQSPAMKFFATGSDGKVIKLHERVASIPISMMGQQFQAALEEEIKDYSDDQVRALAPFEMVGRGIAGVDEMRAAMQDERVQFGMLQIEVGEGTFKRYKNVFVHFQGDKMKALRRAQANRALAAAKEIIGHTHASLVVPNRATFSVEWIFAELKNAFQSDSIAYKGKGKHSDINSVCTHLPQISICSRHVLDS